MPLGEPDDSIRKQIDDNNFLYPCYNNSCISNIPGAILELFNVNNTRPKIPIDLNKWQDKAVDKVVLFVLDGFGYNNFSLHYKENPFLSSLVKKGNVSSLTSIFPSQTTNALTTLNTGLTPQEHGLFEYYIYLKEIDQIVNTLRFEPIVSKHYNELIEKGYNPNILFDGATLQNTLENAGVKTFTHMYIADAFSPYSKILFKRSKIIPSLKSSDLIVNLRKSLEKEKGPAYFFVHLGNLDTIAHEYGPNSYEYSTELSVVSYLLNRELKEKINPRKAKETLMLLTSDHGSVSIAPKKTTYLNAFPEVVKNLQCGLDGKPILPTGSPRDVFLHVKEEKLTKTKDLLTEKIGNKAKIVKTKEEIKKGLFGLGDVKDQFVERAGNLLILPYRNETVWFEHTKGRKVSFRGHHGGLNKNEMLVPLAIANLGCLKKNGTNTLT